MSNTLNKEQYFSLLKALNIPSSLNWEYLFQAYVDAKESSKSFAESNNVIANLDVNDVTLTLYLAKFKIGYSGRCFSWRFKLKILISHLIQKRLKNCPF